MRSVVQCVVLCCLAAWAFAGQNPGIKFRATQKALDYVEGLANAVLKDTLLGLQLEDMDGKTSGIDWSLTNIDTDDVEPPTATLELAPQKQGFKWESDGLSMELSAKWKAKYKYHGIGASTSGHVDIDLKDISFDFLLSIGPNGLQASECESNLHNVKLDFQGGKGWVINKFKSPLQNSVEKMMEDKLCPMIMGQVEALLGKVDLGGGSGSERELGTNLLMDMSMAGLPVITDSFLEFVFDGTVYWKGDKQEPAYSAEPFPEFSGAEKMEYTWISDYVLQTMLDATSSHGANDVDAKLSEIEGIDTSFLNVTCDSGCFGSFISSVRYDYPGGQLNRIKVTSLSSPVVNIDTEGIHQVSDFNIALYVDDAEGSEHFVLDMNTTIGADYTPELSEEGSLVETLDEYNYTLNTEPQEGDPAYVNPFVLKSILGKIVDNVFAPSLKAKGQQGINFAIGGDHLSVSGAEVTSIQNALLIGANFALNSQ